MPVALLSQGMQDSLFQIGQVDVTAERIFEKERAGMKETLVDSMVLQEKLNASLSGLLSENTSLFIKDHGRGALATASFRGTSASHTRVSWNGMNISSPMTGMVDFSLIPVYLVDEIQLKHGTASIADKSGGLGGAVNINNTVSWDEKIGIKYLQGVGSYSTFDEFLQVGGGNRKVQVKTRLYHNYSENNYPFINRALGTLDPETGMVVHLADTNDQADYVKYGLLQEVYYRPDQRNMLSVRYWGQRADRTLPRATSYEGPDNSNLNEQEDADHKMVAGWRHYGGGTKLELTGGYASKQLGYVLKNHVPGLGILPVIYSVSSQQSYQGTLAYSRELTGNLSVEAHLDAGYHDVSSRDTVSGTGYAQQRTEVSGYMAVQNDFADRLHVKLMLRQDWVDGRFVPVIPYLGFDFRVLQGRALFLKGNIARNYRQPSLNDLYWQPGGNSGLLPEEGFSMEFGAEYQRTVGDHFIKAEATVFRSDIDHWIIWIPGFKGYWEPKNIRRVLSQGVEAGLSLHGSLGRVKYRAAGTYAFTRSVNYGDPLVWGDASYGKQLVYVPLHSGNFMFNVSRRGFFLTLQHNSYSERYTTSGNDLSRRDRLYPYYMNDLVLGKVFVMKNARMTARFQVNNLFNETYHTVLYRPMPGRNYMVILLFDL